MKKVMESINQYKQIILFATILMSIVIGYWTWNVEFTKTYYSEATTLQGQLFPNVANTSVETVENFPLFTDVPYDKVVLKIGSLASEYDDSNQAGKSNNIIDSGKLDKNFKKWLIKAFDRTEAEKITDHLEVYYRGEKIHEISY